MKYNSAPDDYDRRQLWIMVEMLRREDFSQSQLLDLANGLIALRDLLHWHDPEWRRSFTDNIVTLDSCALASTEQQQKMGVRYEQVIQDTLASLRHLVSHALVDGQLEKEDMQGIIRPL